MRELLVRHRGALLAGGHALARGVVLLQADHALQLRRTAQLLRLAGHLVLRQFAIVAVLDVEQIVFVVLDDVRFGFMPTVLPSHLLFVRCAFVRLAWGVFGLQLLYR